MPFAVEQSPGTTAAAISAEWKLLRREPAATAFSSAVESWPDSISDRLAQLLKLPPGWDGHTARPIGRTIVNLRLLGTGPRGSPGDTSTFRCAACVRRVAARVASQRLGSGDRNRRAWPALCVCARTGDRSGVGSGSRVCTQ